MTDLLSSLTSTLAAQISAERNAAHLTQAEFAEQIGVSARAVQEWEAGRSLPRPKHRRALAKWLAKNGKKAA